MKIIKKSGDILGGILMIVSLILLIPLLLTNMGINSYIILSGAGDPHRKYGTGGYSNGKYSKWRHYYVSAAKGKRCSQSCGNSGRWKNYYKR